MLLPHMAMCLRECQDDVYMTKRHGYNQLQAERPYNWNTSQFIVASTVLDETKFSVSTKNKFTRPAGEIVQACNLKP
jgi:hypothetical protein